MGLLKNIIERKADYLHKERNKSIILHSDIDMGNNKITNLGKPGSPMMQFQKDFFINESKNSLMIIALKVFLVISIQLRMRLLNCNRVY